VLRVRHFRNLGEQELVFPADGVAIVGPNAQGKTNLLEAIYYLETFRSFRGSSADQLTGFGQEGFWVGAEVEADLPEVDPVAVTAGYQRSGRRRKVTVDGDEPGRVGDAIGKLGAVVFSPSDVTIVNDGPDQRRRFLDIVLSLNAPGYLDALQRYRHVLSQRNAALKANQPDDVVRAWDHALAESGGAVMLGRHRWVEAWSETFSRYYTTISGGRSATMAYAPRHAAEKWTQEGIVEDLARGVRDAWDSDLRNRTTTVGPHRDELSLGIEDDAEPLEVRRYGSGGQRRTAALALRLVEAATIRSTRGREPMVLMDDVFAELDETRSERILDLLHAEEAGQVILTAPKDSDVRLRADSLARWRIERGRIVA